MSNRPIFVIGDVHGEYDKLIALLRSASLMNPNFNWIGGDSTLWFMGDFFDRGAHGIACMELVMQLQDEAFSSGGEVQSLLGNHEMVLLSAYFFGEQPTAWGGTFLSDWLRNGGQSTDLSSLREEHIVWIMNLPAMAHVDGRLFLHADALFYEHYGSSVAEVNEAFKALLRSKDPAAWDRLLAEFSERGAFFDAETDINDSASSFLAEQYLRKYGGKALVHGHTPISKFLKKPDRDITGPLIYAGGLCVDVDGGMNKGGLGFVYELPPLEKPGA